MGKILFWAVVIFGVLIVTRLLTHHAANRKSGEPAHKEDPRSIKASEEMVSCAHCQVYLPKSDAVNKNDHYWCSPEHAEQGVRHPL